METWDVVVVGAGLAGCAVAWHAGGRVLVLDQADRPGAEASSQNAGLVRRLGEDPFERALAMHGTPFVNTIYADASGDALYVDGSRVPALTDDGLAGWMLARKLVPAVDAAWRSGLVVLDGSNPASFWYFDPPPM